jgi:hypothetical protein
MTDWEFNDQFTPEDFMEIVEHLEELEEEDKRFAHAPKLDKQPELIQQKSIDKPKNENTIQALRAEIDNLRKEIEIRDAQLFTMYHHLVYVIKRHL